MQMPNNMNMKKMMKQANKMKEQMDKLEMRLAKKLSKYPLVVVRLKLQQNVTVK